MANYQSLGYGDLRQLIAVPTAHYFTDFGAYHRKQARAFARHLIISPQGRWQQNDAAILMIV